MELDFDWYLDGFVRRLRTGSTSTGASEMGASASSEASQRDRFREGVSAMVARFHVQTFMQRVAVQYVDHTFLRYVPSLRPQP